MSEFIGKSEKALDNQDFKINFLECSRNFNNEFILPGNEDILVFIFEILKKLSVHRLVCYLSKPT